MPKFTGEGSAMDRIDRHPDLRKPIFWRGPEAIKQAVTLNVKYEKMKQEDGMGEAGLSVLRRNVQCEERNSAM